MSVDTLQHLADLPYSVQATLPAATPPPGVTPNFENPESIVPLITGWSTTFFAIATIFLALRLYMKTFVIRKWRIEDVLLTFAYIFAILMYSAGLVSAYIGTMGKHNWDMHLSQVFYTNWFYVIYVTAALPLEAPGLAKIAILIQYWNLFSSKRGMRIAILLGLIVMSVFYISWSIILIVFVAPWPGETQIASLVSWHGLEVADWVLPLGIISMVFDYYILILPLRSVWKLQMPRAKKFGVMLMFLTGILACAATTVGVYYRVNFNLEDQSWTIGYIFLWGQIEMWSGIIIACAPTVHQFWNRHRSLVRLSDMFKSSVARLSGGSHRNTAGPATQKVDHHHHHPHHQSHPSDDRHLMVRPSHSMDTMTPNNDHELSDLEMGMGMGKKHSLPDDGILVEHSYTVSAAERSGHTHHNATHASAGSDSDTDVENNVSDHEAHRGVAL